jgi:aspartate/methionine/tyrosine aminotransferase
MKQIVKIPSKQYFDKAYKILIDGDVNLRNAKYDYYGLNAKIFSSQQLASLMEKNGLTKRYKISSGTSDRFAFKGYINQVITDLKKGIYYRFYSLSKGDLSTRKAISLMENFKFFKKNRYTEEDVCMTEGSTGGISMIIEYFKNTNPADEILIISPSYYLYKFTAEYYNLKYVELVSLDKIKPFMFNLELFKKSITPKTKLIILNRPNNPTGEIYPEEIVRKILMIAKKNDALVLVDELFFELILNKESATEVDAIASKIDVLDRIITVKGYSKNKNLAAFRIGYVLSKNRKLMASLARIAEQRQCFSSAQNYTGLICLDSFIQSVGFYTKQNQSLTKAIAILKQKFSFSQIIFEKSEKELKNLYLEYKKYFNNKIRYYSDTYDMVLDLFGKEVEMILPKTCAYNTLIKLKGLENVNFFDFCFNLFLTTGIESQIGPCFAFDQFTWQKNPAFGFWLRISYSRDQEMFKEAIIRLIEFKKIYLENKDKFLKTNIIL